MTDNILTQYNELNRQAQLDANLANQNYDRFQASIRDREMLDHARRQTAAMEYRGHNYAGIMVLLLLFSLLIGMLWLVYRGLVWLARVCTHKRRHWANVRSWGKPDVPGWRQ
jgi:hypothetical protein